jgi:hypothetical protein
MPAQNEKYPLRLDNDALKSMSHFLCWRRFRTLVSEEKISPHLGTTSTEKTLYKRHVLSVSRYEILLKHESLSLRFKGSHLKSAVSLRVKCMSARITWAAFSLSHRLTLILCYDMKGCGDLHSGMSSLKLSRNYSTLSTHTGRAPHFAMPSSTGG